MFELDGIDFDDTVAITSFAEKFEILNGKKSGRLQTGPMFIEKVGTFYNYSMTFVRRNAASKEKYDLFAKMLANPNNEHTITVPHNQTLRKNYRVYIAAGQRKLIQTKRLSGDLYNSRWGGLTVDFIAMDKIDYEAE